MSDIPTTHTLPEDALRLMRTAFRMDPRSARCLEEAEAELTRLRADLAAAQERERVLREALEQIAEYLPSFDYVGRDDYGIRTDFPGSPYDRGKADASKHLSGIACAALSAMRGEP